MTYYGLREAADEASNNVIRDIDKTDRKGTVFAVPLMLEAIRLEIRAAAMRIADAIDHLRDDR